MSYETTPGVSDIGAVMYVNTRVPQSYVNGDSVMSDLTGSSTVFNFKSGQTIPPLVNGDLDFSSSTNNFKLSDQLSVLKLSLWLNKVDFFGTTLIDLRELTFGGESAQVENGIAHGTFFTGGDVYLNGAISSFPDVDNVTDGQFVNIVFVGAHLSAPQTRSLGKLCPGEYIRYHLP